METIKIDCTDIFLDDKGQGAGKITVSDTCWDYNFSYYWGAMGSDLKKFLLTINPDYFAGKLSNNERVFDCEASMENVHVYIKEEIDFEDDFYPSAQKELIERLEEIESEACDSNSFVDLMVSLPDHLMCYDLDYKEEERFKRTIRGLSDTPWYFLETKGSPQVIWLKELLPKIKKVLNEQELG